MHCRNFDRIAYKKESAQGAT